MQLIVTTCDVPGVEVGAGGAHDLLSARAKASALQFSPSETHFLVAVQHKGTYCILFSNNVLHSQALTRLFRESFSYTILGWDLNIKHVSLVLFVFFLQLSLSVESTVSSGCRECADVS